MLLPSFVSCWEGELVTKAPTGPGVVPATFATVQLLHVPQFELQLAVPENPHCWYPSGTAIEPDMLDVHIKNIFAVKVLNIVLVLDGRYTEGLSLVGIPPGYGYLVSRPGA